jgi:hypothetical protein
MDEPFTVVGASGSKGGGALRLGNREVEVAPVDAEVVSRFFEQGLMLRADAEQVQARKMIARPDNGLLARVGGNGGVHVEVEGDVVLCVVARADAEGEVRDRA